MKQVDLGLNLSSKRTHKRGFLEEMNRAVPWAALLGLISPYYPAGQMGRCPFALESMLRIHFMQHWFGLSDPAMEEVLFDVPLYREFAQLDSWTSHLPDESTILRFRYRLEKHKLAAQILAVVNEVLQGKGLLLEAGNVVDATLINAPSSTKNGKGERYPEMAHTNGIESVWALLKRGFYGFYHKFVVKHLQRYINECTFCLNECNCRVHTIWAASIPSCSRALAFA